MTQALEGIRILDFSSSVAAPTVTRILGSMGAEVRKVKWPGHPPMRTAMFATDSERDIDNGSFFSTLSIGKESLTLNAGRPEGMRVVERLIAECDVVIESFSTRMLRRWRLDYERISALHPGVIYLSISGFGRSCPYAGYDTWGPTAQAFAGLSATSGLPGYEPAAWGFSYLGICGGYMATIALFAALHARQTTGVGQYIAVAQAEVGISLTGQAMLDTQRNGRSHNRSGFPPGNRGHSDLEGRQEVLRRLGNEGRGRGLRPDYDCFTFIALRQIEELGLCEREQSPDFVTMDRIGPGVLFRSKRTADCCRKRTSKGVASVAGRSWRESASRPARRAGHGLRRVLERLSPGPQYLNMRDNISALPVKVRWSLAEV